MRVTPRGLIERLQSCDESQEIEAKAARVALGKSVLETLSAFSNEPGLGGGYLLLGLQGGGPDNRYTVVGVDNPDKVQQELVTACRHAFNTHIYPKILVEQVGGKIVIAAHIPEACPADKPVFVKRLGVELGSFRRIGPADHRCTVDDLDLLYQLRGQRSFESETLPSTTWQDIDSTALYEYRRIRAEVNPDASELKLDDQELLLSLGVAFKKDENPVPTVGGILLFGTASALRRLMPLSSRVDYILVEGTEWVENPSARYQTIEFRAPLIFAMQRLHSHIMNDLPTQFLLSEGSLQRSDKPSIPRDVIREALANALMHRDYRIKQPTQIIHYSNRIEFRNPGYSLKPFEQLGQPGSNTRNENVAAVFHEIRFAETKGTGIRAMQRWMREAGLSTPPLIESDREGNRFSLLFLSHHLLDQKALQWLSQFKGLGLSDPEARVLVLAKEVGAVTNQDYRQLNGTGTLVASAGLRRLRDLGLLIMKGRGSRTYYVPDTKGLSEGLTPYTSSLCEGLTPHSLKHEISSIGRRSSMAQVRTLIIKLCSHQALSAHQLGQLLGRDARHLRNRYLRQMIASNDLVYKYPDQPAHPQQAYLVPSDLRVQEPRGS